MLKIQALKTLAVNKELLIEKMISTPYCPTQLLKRTRSLGKQGSSKLKQNPWQNTYNRGFSPNLNKCLV